MGTKGTRLPSALRALRHRNYQLFFGGQLISLTGTWMQSVAQAWLIYRMTNSAVLLGFVGFASQIPVFLLAPVGGAVADRYNRHRILVATQTVSMLLAFALAALTLTGRIEEWHIFVLAALLGVVNAFNIPAQSAFVVDMVGRDDLVNAIALNSSMVNGARIAGPAVAGILVAAIGEGWCFFANALSYVAVIIGLLLIKVEPRRLGRPHPFRAGVAEAFNFVRHTGPVGGLLLLLGLISFTGMRFEVLLPVFAREVLRGGPGVFGLLMGASGVGAILGSMTLAALGDVRWLADWVGYTAAGFGAGLILLSLSNSFPLSGGLMLLIGFTMVAQLDASNTLVQRIVPDELRGRVMAIWTMMLTGLAPFGSLLLGVLAQRFGTQKTLRAGGVACVMGAAAFGFSLPILEREARKLILKRARADGRGVVKMKSGDESAAG